MPEPIEPSVGIPTESVTATEPVTMHEASVPARPAPRRRSRIDLVLILAGILALGGLAFAAGRYTAPAAAATASQDCGPGNGGPGAPGATDSGGGNPGAGG